MGTLRPPDSSSWVAKNKGLSYIPRPGRRSTKKKPHLEQVYSFCTICEFTHVTQAIYLLVTPAVPGQNGRRNWSEAGPRWDRTGIVGHRPLGESCGEQTSHQTAKEWGGVGGGKSVCQHVRTYWMAWSRPSERCGTTRVGVLGTILSSSSKKCCCR